MLPASIALLAVSAVLASLASWEYRKAHQHRCRVMQRYRMVQQRLIREAMIVCAFDLGYRARDWEMFWYAEKTRGYLELLEKGQDHEQSGVD